MPNKHIYKAYKLNL